MTSTRPRTSFNESSECAPGANPTGWQSCETGKLNLGDGLARQDDPGLTAEDLQQYGDALAAL